MTTPDQLIDQRTALREQLIAALTALFRQLGSWRDADAARFTKQAVPLVQGAQQALAELVALSLADRASRATGTTVAPPVIPPGTVTDLRGVPPSEVYTRPFRDVWAALADGKTLPEALDQGVNRLGEVTEGDLQTTYAHANQQGMRRLPTPARPTGWRRVLRGRESCALCVVASTHRYTIAELNPIHPHCIPEGSRVRADQILAVARRSYTGELAVITTAHGDQVSVTPNHPVLTDRGWLAGGQVREDDHLVDSSAFQREAGHGPHEDHRPPLIEDVWRAASVMGLVRVPVSPEDFNGDGTDGEVDIVRTDRDFSTVRDAAQLQRMSENPLVREQGGGIAFPADGISAPLMPIFPAVTHSVMRGSSSGAALLGSHLCGPHATSLRASSDSNPVFTQNSAEGVTADVTFGREGVFRFSGQVGGSQVLDRVTAVGRVPFSGYVYDLHTSREVYEADSHVVHNCDCTVEPIYGRDTARAEDDATLERVHRAVADLTGSPDRGGRASDYRQIQITHDHGELGPMLARPGDTFTGPRQIPST